MIKCVSGWYYIKKTWYYRLKTEAGVAKSSGLKREVRCRFQWGKIVEVNIFDNISLGWSGTSLKDVCVSRRLFGWLLCPLITALHWCHNWRDSVSNLQPHDCLLNRLFRRRSKKTSKLRVTGLLGNSPGTGEFPEQMASDEENFPFDDVIMESCGSIRHKEGSTTRNICCGQHGSCW